jgi:hypothetical protein
VITSNRVAGSTSRFFSYDGPFVISISPTTAPATAGGNVFITGTVNNINVHYIVKFTNTGGVYDGGTVFAGSTTSGGSTDGTGTSALLQSPVGLAVDASDNLYVSACAAGCADAPGV